MSVESPRILVTGATGKIGQLVLQQLSGAGIGARAFSRSASSANVPTGIQTAIGDLQNPVSLESALTDVDTVFLLWPSLSTDGAQDVVESIARRSRRVVYLSTSGAGDPADRALNPISAVHFGIEQMIESAVKEWTFVRSGGFASNTLLWAGEISSGDTVHWPFAEAKRALVHDADIVAVIGHALTTGDLVGAAPILTGPDVLSQRAQVELIGNVIGRPLHFDELPVETAREQMLSWGLPARFADGVLGYLSQCVTSPEISTGTVQDILGRPARSFKDWVETHVAKFS